MRQAIRAGSLGLMAAVLLASGCGASGARDAPPSGERIVFLGDSITDGHTLPLLVIQALRDAGLPPPVCVNAGIGGDTAAGMRRRVDRDVLVHRPMRVALSVGVNDALRGVTQEAYEADVGAIAERLRAARVPLLILTTSILGPTHAEADRRLEGYNTFLRRLARERGYPVAEVNGLMRKVQAGGANVFEADEVHLNQEGYRVMARAVLDALGRPAVAVPQVLKVEVMPGLVRRWKVRAVGGPLDAAAVAALRPDDPAWKDYALPEAQPQAHWWMDQERQRGFATALQEAAGPGGTYVGLATVESKAARRVYLNPGAELRAIWLNGQRIYAVEGKEWRGWHAGRDRVAADLAAGPNTVVIETGPHFFLSVTDDDTW
jgi:lysophospholipase L1-like esterase